MAHTKKPPPKKQPQEKPTILVHSFTVTPEVLAALKQLSRDATDFLGRMVSSSAVVRALVHQAMKQGPPASEALFLEIEKELTDGTVWGYKKK